MTTMLSLALIATESTPAAEDVVAGSTAAWVIGALLVATALLCWSFSRQLKKTRAARDAGVFGEDTDAAPGTTPGDDTPA